MEASFQSVTEVLEHPLVRKARALEVSICDAVHFRLVEPAGIFELAEMRLLKRHPSRYGGFAETRTLVEAQMRGSSILDKIAACCTKHPEWLDDRQVLYSAELEAWMDMSYPNPWTLDLYHAALLKGKAFVIPRLGPFTETFHTLLKEKNGYELTSPAASPEATVVLSVGEQLYPGCPKLNLTAAPRDASTHAFDQYDDLACQLAWGIFLKDIEDHSAKATDEETWQAHAFGFHLIGPLLVPLLQSLFGQNGPVRFLGLGSAFLDELARSVGPVWPDLPEIASHYGILTVSLLPEAGARWTLLPKDPGDDADSLLPAEAWDPPGLVLPALQLFLKAAFEGSQADTIQAGAKAFVWEYACMTRGLQVFLPAEAVVEEWRQHILSPGSDFLRWGLFSGALPGFRAKERPWRVRRAVRAGGWPTGQYLGAGPFWQRWLKLREGDRVKQIRKYL